MCGRYQLAQAGESEALDAIIDEINRKERLHPQQAPIRTAGEVFPGDRVPVLCKGRSGETGAFAMEWGYRLPDGKRLINARMETAAEKPIFRESMQLRRCLLPMTAYFEWEKRGRTRIKYRIAPEEGEMQCLAGIYRFEEGRPVCAVLTMEAAQELSFIHPRMPLILPLSQREEWLNGGSLDPSPRLYFQRLDPEGERQLEMEF